MRASSQGWALLRKLVGVSLLQTNQLVSVGLKFLAIREAEFNKAFHHPLQHRSRQRLGQHRMQFRPTRLLLIESKVQSGLL